MQAKEERMNEWKKRKTYESEKGGKKWWKEEINIKEKKNEAQNKLKERKKKKEIYENKRIMKGKQKKTYEA